MAPILYTLKGSPACRSVSILAKALDIKLDEREINFRTGEHLKAEFIKLNPLHTLPVLNDDEKILCDSHAITMYLIAKCANDDSLYPKDIYQRALVDQKMTFDLGIMFPVSRLVDLAYINKEIKLITPSMIQEIHKVYNFLDIFLKDSKWIALDRVSLADIHCLTTVTCLNYHVKLDSDAYPNAYKWMKRCQELPFCDLDMERIKCFEKYFDTLKIRSFSSVYTYLPPFSFFNLHNIVNKNVSLLVKLFFENYYKSMELKTWEFKR